MSAQPITATQMTAIILAGATPCPICDSVRYFCPMDREKNAGERLLSRENKDAVLSFQAFTSSPSRSIETGIICSA